MISNIFIALCQAVWGLGVPPCLHYLLAITMTTRLLGALIAAPYELLFLSVWIAASVTRPFALVTVICLLSHPTATWRKFQLFISTIQYLILCNDKKWKSLPIDPATYYDQVTSEKDSASSDAKIRRKTVIFVRHGESTWNDTFNKGDRSVVNFILYFIPNLIYAVCCEYYFWVSGQANESWFYDSPLSEKGKRQAMGVSAFLAQDSAYLTPKEAALVSILRGGDQSSSGSNDIGAGAVTNGTSSSTTSSSQLVSSNLRRAIATMAIGFQKRLDTKYDNDKILILPSLQEISRNPDALCITPPYGSVVPAWTDPVASLQPIYDQQVDTCMHTGNKPVASNGLLRIQEFCRIVFTEIHKDSVIVGGHSLWFRSFFQTYLPKNNTHVAKKKKLVNGGVVGFTLLRIEVTPSQVEYMIDPASIVVLHGGF
jgi:hypothetical protein